MRWRDTQNKMVVARRFFEASGRTIAGWQHKRGRPDIPDPVRLHAHAIFPLAGVNPVKGITGLTDDLTNVLKEPNGWVALTPTTLGWTLVWVLLAEEDRRTLPLDNIPATPPRFRNKQNGPANHLGFWVGQGLGLVKVGKRAYRWGQTWEAVHLNEESEPHLMIAGSTGSGKTNLMLILLDQLARVPTTHVKLYIADPRDKLKIADRIPHLAAQRAVDTDAAVNLLLALAEKVRKNEVRRLPERLFVIDELPEVLTAGGTKAANAWATIVKTGRNAGLYVVVGVQKPLVAEFGDSAARAQVGQRLVGLVERPEEARLATGRSGVAQMHRPGYGSFYLERQASRRSGLIQAPLMPESRIEEWLSLSAGEVPPLRPSERINGDSLSWLDWQQLDDYLAGKGTVTKSDLQGWLKETHQKGTFENAALVLERLQDAGRVGEFGWQPDAGRRAHPILEANSAG